MLRTKLAKSLSTKMGALLIVQGLLFIIAFNVIDIIKTSNFERVLDEYSSHLKDIIFMSTYDYLKKGNMVGFQELLDESERLDKVKEFSLLTPDGIVKYSSNKASVGSRDQIDSRMTSETRLDESRKVMFYYPVKTVGYCTRCHTDWKEDSINSFYKITLDKSAIYSIKKSNIIYKGLILLFLVGLTAFAMYGIKVLFLAPINLLSERAQRLAVGDTVMAGIDQEEIRKINSREDELGQVGRSFMKLIEVQKKKAAVADQIARDNLDVKVEIASKYDLLGHSMLRMIKNLKQKNALISDSTRRARQKSDTLNVMATSMNSSADRLSESMGSISAVAEQLTANVNMVATAAEEMTSTVGEIAKNAEKARLVTNDAVENVDAASTLVNDLGHAAKEIDKVIEVIIAIAEQTKLLALNATIEAVRAGEAGKGFAVVANEVKELAKQTNLATGDIRQKIETMQRSSNSTVEKIQEINNIIVRVNKSVVNIAVAVREQTSATDDIARNIRESSLGLNDVSKSVTQAADASKEIAKDISSIKTVSDELKDSSGLSE